MMSETLAIMQNSIWARTVNLNLKRQLFQITFEEHDCFNLRNTCIYTSEAKAQPGWNTLVESTGI